MMPNTKVVQKFIDEYAKVRRMMNPLQLPTVEKWEEVKKYSIEEFDTWINAFTYKSDPLWGAMDYTSHPDHFFNKDAVSSRDCDDWARMWSLWGIYNDYNAIEFIVVNPNTPFKTAHMITVLHKDAKIILCNYHAIDRDFKTYDHALQYMKKYPSYKDGMVHTLSDMFPRLGG